MRSAGKGMDGGRKSKGGGGRESRVESEMDKRRDRVRVRGEVR